MRSRRASWLGVVLIGGLLLVGSGPGVAFTTSPTTEEILAKLDHILAALGGNQDSNHTLRWDQALPSAQRFVILSAFNNEVVLDKNTGLVWEKAPNDSDFTWAGALDFCITRTVGDTVGWRLPSAVELRSALDLALPAPKAPNSIFIGVLSRPYWSATSLADTPTRAYLVDFGGGTVGTDPKGATLHHVWCVRGPMQESVY